MGENIPLPGCVDLRAQGTTVHDPSEQSKTPDELCDICCNIDIVKLVSNRCPDHEQPHYHLGMVKDILSRKGCALCRMISAIHNSAGRHNLDASSEECILETTYWGDEIKVYFTVGQARWDFENTAAVHVIRRCIEDWMVDRWMNEDGIAVSSSALTGSCIGGRRVPQQVDFGLIRNWLYLCETSHNDTCSPRGLISRTAGKIRLVDVMNLQIIDGTTNERYLALSYVWGPGKQFCLNSQNEGNLRKPYGIKIDSVPRTIRDAINLVAKIGERYLWIDRLCILMDDERDKSEQMSRMDQIYNSAALTVINGDACCSDAPIAGVEPGTRRSLQHSEVIRGVSYITTQSDLIPQILLTNWSTRGWTYQEAFLSPRCLVFTRYQAYFQCKSDVCSEDSRSHGPPSIKDASTIGNALCHLPDFDALPKIRCGFYQYIDSIEAFSRRRLTEEADALWAFAGITKAFQAQFPMGFTWGLPIENLDAALLWHPSRFLGGLREGLHTAIVDSQAIRLPFPSWSWTSWRGGVSFHAKCEEETKGLVKWHQPICYAVDAAEPLSMPWHPATDHNAPNPVPAYDDRLNSSSHVVMDERALGLLRFTASSMTLSIEVMDLGNIQASKSGDNPVSRDCKICTRTGKTIGTIQVPSSWLENNSHKVGECILLSVHIEDIEDEICRRVWHESEGLKTSTGVKHSDDCEHQSKYNVMLIDWKSTRNNAVAYRVGITQILKKDWVELESSLKVILLG
jgi:hypothetical protein